MNKNEFIQELEKLNIEITEEKLAKLEKFYQLLIEWNQKINLTRITEKKDGGAGSTSCLLQCGNHRLARRHHHLRLLRAAGIRRSSHQGAGRAAPG